MMHRGYLSAIGATLFAISLYSCKEQPEYVEKIYPIQEEVELKLAGKWEIATVDNVPVLTNEKQVVTYQEGWTAHRSIANTEVSPVWMNKQAFKCSLYGHDVTENNTAEQSVPIKITSNVETIEGNQMVAVVRTIYSTTDTTQNKSHFIVYRKIDKDFTNEIVGYWEVKLAQPGIPGITDHRISFREDGTFLMFDRDTTENEWVENRTTTNRYMLDGSWLALRKQTLEPATDERECWDISIEGDKMYWNALRADSADVRHEDQLELTRITE